MGTVASTRVQRSPLVATPESPPAPAPAAPSTSAAPSAPASASASTPATEVIRALLPCEIRVVDEESREIELCATSEAVDAHGTIFGYEASRDAFSRWVGNVREMHERKAVGRRVAVRYDDDARQVHVRMRISKGAEDTWEKIKDGTLSGASIGASNVSWRRQRVNGADIPYATRYDLVELSLVDSPSNPDASGVTFVRNAAPDETLLGELGAGAPDEITVRDGVEVGPATLIREGAGALSNEDPAAAIAQAALTRGRAALAPQLSAQLTRENAQGSREGDVAAGQNGSGFTANELRLARLGAPTYAARVARGLQNAANMQLSSAGSGSAACAIPASDSGPGAAYDADGDHDASGAADAMGLEHGDELHAHAAHDHPHSGVYDDRHVHNGPHLHQDGTSHTHDHGHDHGHHDHASMSEWAQAGHSHPHVHAHDHGHYYRVADGSPLDERLVTGEQLRTREYVSEVAFRAAGGVAGTGLSAAQYRVAAGVELRLELAAAERAQGAFSRNPLGAADIGTPAAAAETSTDAAIAASATGQVTDLDRDGQPATCDDVSSTGQLDVTAPPDGYAELTERRNPAPAAPGPDPRWEPERALAAEFTAAMAAEVGRVSSALNASLSEIQQRLARIEAHPMPGGPALRVADRTSALAGAAGGSSSSSSSTAQRIEALSELRGRISDPQAQVAVAAEMIRLQQEAAGMPASYQVMPRAGRGWSDEK